MINMSNNNMIMNSRPVYKANSTTKCQIQSPERIVSGENSNNKTSTKKSNVMIPRLMINFASGGSDNGGSIGSRHNSTGSTQNKASKGGKD